jgi:RNA polymerase sigma-70 factor (ECF subfamily)
VDLQGKGKVRDVLPREAPEAYKRFYREETPRLMAFLLKLGFAGGIAEDATQQAMFRAYERWDGIASPAAWIRTVAARSAATAATRERERTLRQEGAGTEPTCAPDPYAELDARMELDWLLQLLPPRQREVLVWTFDGFAVGDIADALEIAPETVRSNLRHARARIKSIYDRRKGERHG